MSDFIGESVGIPVQRVDSEEAIDEIQLGNTIGDRDWAWENICSEKELLEKSLRLKIDELQQLQFEHEDLKERLVENERQKKKVQEDLEKQMDNTQKMIARLNQEKSRNKTLEKEMNKLKQLEGKVNDITNRNYDLEQNINTLNVLLQKCMEEVQNEKTKTKFLEQMYDRKDSALEKTVQQNRRLKKKLSILTEGLIDNSTDQDDKVDNKRFKSKRIQECRRCHKALVPGQNTEICCYHPRKPVHLPGNNDPKMMVWQCCQQSGKIEPPGCKHHDCHEPL